MSFFKEKKRKGHHKFLYSQYIQCVYIEKCRLGQRPTLGKLLLDNSFLEFSSQHGHSISGSVIPKRNK